MRKSKNDTVTNIGSWLLGNEENVKVFELLGDGCKTKSTAVVQLYKTKNPYHTQWFKQYTGVLCLVRDSNYKKYFFRLYCTESKTLLWEFQIPPGFEYVESASFMHQFCAADCVYGFNFADLKEAKIFVGVVRESVKTIKLPKRDQRAKTTRKQQSNKTKKAQKPVISQPVGFKHVQHFGFNDWRDLNSEIDKLSGKNQNVSEKVGPTMITNDSTPALDCQLKQEVGGEIHQISKETPIETEAVYETIEEESETSYKPQVDFLAELSCKFGSVREIQNEPSNSIQFPENTTFVRQEDDEFLRQAIKTRQCAIGGEEEDDFDDDFDDDDWD